MTDRSAASDACVGIVVVNFRGEDRTLACLEALSRSAWPAHRRQVVVVDNGSRASFAREVRAKGAHYIDAGANVGFPAACNLGIDHLAPGHEFIALVNNDALPASDWLGPLTRALEEDPGLAGVCPRILLAGNFVRLTIALCSPTRRAGGGDERELGVQLSGVRVDGLDVTSDVQLGEGFWGWENGEPAGRFAWTSDRAVALVPVANGAVSSVEVRLSSVFGGVDADVDAGAGATLVRVHDLPIWTNVGTDIATGRLVNSTGIELRPDGSCADRDYQELEVDVASTPAETFACSGAAVLLRTAFLRDVGPMDGRFFLYYEDVDLCWRGRLRGWRFAYASDAVVVHEHSATVGAGSRLAAHLAARNRLLVLTKAAPRELVTRAVFAAVRDLAKAVANDVVRRAARAERPAVEHVTVMARVLAGFLRLAPYAARERRRIGRRATVDRRRAMQMG